MYWSTEKGHGRLTRRVVSGDRDWEERCVRISTTPTPEKDTFQYPQTIG